MRLPRVPAPPRHDSTHDFRPGFTRFPRLTRFIIGLALIGLTPLLACATSPDKPAHRNGMERPAPFASAPDVTVSDATGIPRDLASLMGPKGLVLVLYRGHW